MRMKKGKIIVGILFFVVIVFDIIIFLDEKNKAEESQAEKVSKQIVSDFLTKYRESDKSCREYLKEDKENFIKFQEFQILLGQSLEYDIQSVQKDENSEYDIVNIIIDNVDFEETINQVIDKGADTGESILEGIKKLLQDESAPRTKFKIKVFVDTKEKQLIMSEDLSNALLGGYHKYIYNLTEEVILNEEDFHNKIVELCKMIMVLRETEKEDEGIILEDNGDASKNPVGEEELVNKEIDLDEYEYDSDLTRLSRDLGEEINYSLEDYKECIKTENLFIGIVSEKYDEYDTITDIKNTGNKSVVYSGIRIGDNYKDVKAILESQYAVDENEQDPIDGVHVFYFGDSAHLETEFQQGKLISYQCKIRYTTSLDWLPDMP